MEPFSISCTTCQARLRVQDESAIGQILACPKCGSMVMIEAPATAKSDPPGDQGDSQVSATKPARQTPTGRNSDPSLDRKAPGSPSDTPRTTPNEEGSADRASTKSDRPARKFRFREDFDNASEDSEATPRDRQATVTAAPPRHPDAVRQVADPVSGAPSPIPPVSPVRSTLRRYQQWLLIGAAAVVGLALALLVVGILSTRRNRPSDEPVAKTTVSAKAPDADAPTAPASAEKEADAHDEPAGGDAPATDDASAPDDRGKKPADTAIDAPDDSEPPVDSASVPDVRPPGDSIDADGSGTDSAPDMVAPVTDAADSHIPEDELPPADDAGASDVDADSSNVKSQLLFPFVAIELKADDAVSLADFCVFMSSAIDVPITLEIDALYAARISPHEVVECNLRGTTAGQALESVLEPLGAGFSVEAGSIVIAPPDTDQFSEVTYDVSDLTEDASQAMTLAEQIRSLVDQASWEQAGGEGSIIANERKLRIHQTPVTHYRITRLLDRLRTVRKLLPRSDLPRSMLEASPAFLQAAGNLGLTVSATFPRPTALDQVLRHLQAESDMLVLADWPALSAAGIPASYTVSPSLPSQPFHKLLDSLLAPLKLGYRVTDAGTIQISSQEALRNHLEVELYRIADDPTLDVSKLIAEVKAYVGEPFFISPNAPGEIFFDAPSRCLLVSLPQPQQRAVAAWLTLNRKTVPAAGPGEL